MPYQTVRQGSGCCSCPRRAPGRGALLQRPPGQRAPSLRIHRPYSDVLPLLTAKPGTTEEWSSARLCLAPVQRQLRVICLQQLLGLVCVQQSANMLGVMTITDKSRCPPMMRLVASCFYVTLPDWAQPPWMAEIPAGGGDTG